MIESEEQQTEPDFSGCAFLGQEPGPVKKVDEAGMAFHTENQMPPAVAILDLGCTRAIASRNAINAVFDTTMKRGAQDLSMRMRIHNNGSALRSLSFACTYDKAWNVHTTACDIVEGGDVPLLMSLPQMRHLGFQFEPTTEVIPGIYQTRNLEASAQDVKEHSFRYGIPRHCLVYECSLFQDT